MTSLTPYKYMRGYVQARYIASQVLPNKRHTAALRHVKHPSFIAHGLSSCCVAGPMCHLFALSMHDELTAEVTGPSMVACLYDIGFLCIMSTYRCPQLGLASCKSYCSANTKASSVLFWNVSNIFHAISGEGSLGPYRLLAFNEPSSTFSVLYQ
jgi:hypothetical protein